jgi:hypothetical protein
VSQLIVQNISLVRVRESLRIIEGAFPLRCTQRKVSLSITKSVVRSGELAISQGWCSRIGRESARATSTGIDEDHIAGFLG